MSKMPDATSAATLQSQKQAIFAGLTSILSEDEANKVIEKWSTYFKETDSIFNGLNSFAREVCKKFNKDDQQRELVRALNRALINKDKVAATPTTSKDEPKKVIISAPVLDTKPVDNGAAPITDISELYIDQPISTPDFQTFQYLLLQIINLVEDTNEDAAIALNPFLTELTMSMPWSETQQQQLIILIASGETTQMRNYRPDQLKLFLKHLRSWLVDEMGTKDATRVLHEAFKATDASPAGAKYPTKNFI